MIRGTTPPWPVQQLLFAFYPMAGCWIPARRPLLIQTLTSGSRLPGPCGSGPLRPLQESMNQLDPTHIMQTATGFWASKVLLTAVEFDLFSTLGDRSMTAEQLGAALGLHPRGRYDFFDALVALGFLHRDGDGPEGRYRNTPETAAFLVKQSPTYIGGMPEMFNSRLFGFWNSLGEALKTASRRTRSNSRASRCSPSSMPTKPGSVSFFGR